MLKRINFVPAEMNQYSEEPKFWLTISSIVRMFPKLRANNLYFVFSLVKPPDDFGFELSIAVKRLAIINNNVRE